METWHTSFYHPPLSVPLPHICIYFISLYAGRDESQKCETIIDIREIFETGIPGMKALAVTNGRGAEVASNPNCVFVCVIQILFVRILCFKPICQNYKQ